jgi:hypothetical protein
MAMTAVVLGIPALHVKNGAFETAHTPAEIIVSRLSGNISACDVKAHIFKARLPGGRL